MIHTMTFVETSPSSAIAIASSQPVQGADVGLPGGVAGLLGDYSSAAIIAELVGATGGTLSVVIQGSPDGGLNFYDLIRFPTITAGAATAFYSAPLSTKTQTAAPVVVGKNNAPALAASTVVNGGLTDRLRLMMTGGSGTTLGAQVVIRICAHRRRTRETGA